MIRDLSRVVSDVMDVTVSQPKQLVVNGDNHPWHREIRIRTIDGDTLVLNLFAPQPNLLTINVEQSGVRGAHREDEQ